jgi:hypothetical protein
MAVPDDPSDERVMRAIGLFRVMLRPKPDRAQSDRDPSKENLTALKNPLRGRFSARPKPVDPAHSRAAFGL